MSDKITIALDAMGGDFAPAAVVEGALQALEQVGGLEVTLVGRPKERVRMGRFGLLEWEYGALAMFQRGGSDWSDWYGAAKSALVGHQRKDGCARGSWDPVGLYERNVGGRLLSTVLGVLVLEEPCRHRRP